MALTAGNAITASDMNALKSRVNAEMARRKYSDNGVSLATWNRAFTVTPVAGSTTAIISQFNETVGYINKIKSQGISTDFIYAIQAASTNLTNYANRPIYSNKTDCSSGCTGLCYTTCSSTCKNTCGEACYARCNTTCMVDSSSNPGCANVGCSTYCKNVCRTATCYDNPNITPD